MLIDVCQYMRPNGRKQWNKVEINDSYEEKYKQLLSLNGIVSAEVLMDGTVVVYLEQMPDGFEIFMEHIDNGPQVLTAINKMFEDFSVDEWNSRLSTFIS